MSIVNNNGPGDWWEVTSTDTGGKLTDKELMELAKNYIQQQQQTRVYQQPHPQPNKDYSLAQVQLSDGTMIGMTITASPSLGSYLAKTMAETGYLNLHNDTESLIIKADRVVAVQLTKMSKE